MTNARHKAEGEGVTVDGTGRILVSAERIRAILNISQGTLQNRVADGEYPKAGRGLYDLAACVQAELRIKSRGEGYRRGSRPPSDPDRLGSLWHFASRLEDWEAIYSRPERSSNRTVEEIAPEFQADRKAVLTWLRAGMPYVKAGDWRTGDGFTLKTAWVFDWVLALSCLEHCPGQQVAARELRLPYV